MGRDRDDALAALELEMISIHTPQVGRDIDLCTWNQIADISIHTPQVGRDGRLCCARRCFYHISIHTPQVGRDTLYWRDTYSGVYFNPHAPGGARQYVLENR